MRINIRSSKLPEAFEGYKIVQFSDAHLGTWGEDTVFFSKFVDKINSLKPDLIVFTGDLVNGDAHEMSPFRTILTRLKAKDGVYSVLGNHDYGEYINWSDMTEKETNLVLMNIWQKQSGWNLLNNSNSTIYRGNDSIKIIGVENWGEPPFKQYGDIDAAYPETRHQSLLDDNFKILLTHNPEFWNRIVKNCSNIDLTLSGHTHSMQMECSFNGKRYSPAEFKYKYWGGLYSDESEMDNLMYLYVNRGCGEVGMPARYGTAKPEITEIVLHGNEN